MALPKKKGLEKGSIPVLEGLEKYLLDKNIPVEYKNLNFAGGLCFIHKKPTIILNSGLTIDLKILKLLEILNKTFPDKSWENRILDDYLDKN